MLSWLFDDNPWERVGKFDKLARRVVDGEGPFGNGVPHYSRRKPGATQFMPPGETAILIVPDGSAVFGWWRPHPRSGIKAMNGLDGWTCTVFRRDAGRLASELIVAAEAFVSDRSCGPDGLLTYVDRKGLRSANPGFCFIKAGWSKRGYSADRRKRLLSKPVDRIGIAA